MNTLRLSCLPAVALPLLPLLLLTIFAAEPASPPLSEEHLDYERAYQQDLARRRAEEAKARAKFDQERAAWEPAKQYEALLGQARQYLGRAQFQWAIRRYNEAMQVRPREIAITDEVRQLQATLQAQNTPLDVVLKSDGLTFVTISEFKPLRTFDQTTVKLLPGNYEVVGQRKGYRDVRIPLVLRKGAAPPPTITVVCTESARP